MHQHLLMIGLTCAIILTEQTRVLSQASRPEAPAGDSASLIMSLVPEDAVACVTFRMQQVAQDQSLRLIPWEIITAAGMDELGFDPMKVDRVDFIVGKISQEFASMAAVVTTKEKIDISKINLDQFGEEVTLGEGGRKYRATRRELMGVSFLNERQAVIGPVAYVENLLRSKRGPGPLSQQLSRLGEMGHVSAVIVPEPMRPLLLSLVTELPEPIQADATVLIQKINLIAARTQVATDVMIPVVIETASDADATVVESSWNRLVSFGAQQAVHMAERSQGGSGLTDQAMVSYQKRVVAEVQRLLKPTRNGARLMLRFDDSLLNLVRGFTMFQSVAPMVSRFLPPRDGRGGSGRAMFGGTTNDNLRTLALAFHNYHDAYRTFPVAGDTNAQNRKQLSWRVNVLPFLGDPQLTRLYQEFHHDEPYDSEHNLPLAAQMPKIYQHAQANLPPGHTIYQMPTGLHLAGEPGKRMQMRDIIDGASNTVMIALSTDQAAVPWTKPDDFNPLENPDLLRSENGKYLFALFDGSVMELPSNIAAEQVKAWLTRDGGEESIRERQR